LEEIGGLILDVGDVFEDALRDEGRQEKGCGANQQERCVPQVWSAIAGSRFGHGSSQDLCHISCGRHPGQRGRLSDGPNDCLGQD
jgi:hypothetical protein